ncbi:required for drug-induced death protein 1 isoform 1-T1 [Leptodactylus fuscus]|uniref:required for drug-induced death protein 1 n=1 Tax=Leptodactylus fuscus TaxID=238119 RepID=UPI003F4E7BCB
MAGRPKIRGKKKNKYRKMAPDQGQGAKTGAREEPEPQEPAEPCKTPKKKEKKQRSSKKVHLSPLPDRYEPLEENVEDTESKEDKKYKRKQKVKKYAKNVGKAVRTSCRYLIIGLQGLANAYIAPFGATSVVLSTATR